MHYGIIWQHGYYASSQAFVTYAAYLFFWHNDAPIPSSVAACCTIAE
jgi:hypothetical protein